MTKLGSCNIELKKKKKHWQPMRCSKSSVLQFSRCFFLLQKHRNWLLNLTVRLSISPMMSSTHFHSTHWPRTDHLFFLLSELSNESVSLVTIMQQKKMFMPASSSCNKSHNPVFFPSYASICYLLHLLFTKLKCRTIQFFFYLFDKMC